MATVESIEDTGERGTGLRLLRRNPRLATRLARSLLAERRRIRRDDGERLPLRELFGSGGARELARRGGRIDPDLAFRALAHAIDPAWTKDEHFTVDYELTGEGGGRWAVRIDDGTVRVDALAPGAEPDPSPTDDGAEPRRRAVVSLSAETWQSLVAGTLSPTTAMQSGLTEVEGDIPAVTLLGRWIERADGRDGPELEREQRQRELQESRLGSWGSQMNGAGGGAIDPAQRSAGMPRDQLLSYEQLYAL